MRSSVTVRSNFSPSARNPGALIYATHGAPKMPSSATTTSTSVSAVATWSTRVLVASCPRRFLYSARIGTNACENAPSANIRRSRLGILKATKKASVIIPAPKMRAMTASRTNPRMRESRVMLLTAARALSKFMNGPCGFARIVRVERGRCNSVSGRLDFACLIFYWLVPYNRGLR